MTSMIDSIRILLKAYGEELTLEQINKILAGRAENLKDEIKKAIPDLLASKQIIQTKDNIYKNAILYLIGKVLAILKRGILLFMNVLTPLLP